MKAIAILIYGVLCYALSQATLLYAVGFIGNIGVPKSIDSTPTVPLWQGLLINLGLLTVFALQHSIMARPAFKRQWTKLVPEPAERSTFVLFSSIALALLFVFWQPLGGEIWRFEQPVALAAAYAIFATGWMLVVTATYQINHFELFGLRQVWLNFRGESRGAIEFGTPGLYRYVRHPLYFGMLLAFWSTPVMTVTHLLFALGTTAYILVAIRFEERDLLTEHGADYAQYQEAVPMIIPRPIRKD
jgi:methanethiol S-methyltransferase